MNNEYTKIRKGLVRACVIFLRTIQFFRRSASERGLLAATIALLEKANSVLKFGIEQLSLVGTESSSSIFAPVYAKQRLRCQGLHSSLPNIGKISILVAFQKADERSIKTTILSCLDQTAPGLEVLVAFESRPNKSLLTELRSRAVAGNICLKTFERSQGLPKADHINFLAGEAGGDFFLLISEGSWLRPDLLYRFHETLLLSPNRKDVVLYSAETRISRSGRFLAGTQLYKPDQAPFPFVFRDIFRNCLLFSKNAWIQCEGLRPERGPDCIFDLALRMDLTGKKFKGVPFVLHGVQVDNKALQLFPQTTEEGASALQSYGAQKGLNWKVTVDYDSSAYRVHPARPDRKLRVHALVPFKGQKDLTLQCLRALRKSCDANFWITVIDNQSNDADAVSEIAREADELVVADFPFNYSRLNNFGLRSSRCPNEYDLLLLLNNDVIMGEDSLPELASWLEFPSVGIVGAKLLYPSGLIQHGGVLHSRFGYDTDSSWKHIDQHRTQERALMSRSVTCTDAVTAACALIRKRDFVDLAGFDEYLYPIAFSDSDLCLRLRRKGLACIYTPFATAIHYESVSRGLNYIEDYESSEWLNRERDLFEPSVCCELRDSETLSHTVDQHFLRN